MKKCYLFLLCALLMATSAVAQIDLNDNGIGIYADLDGLTNEVELEVGVPLEVYLLLTRPTGVQLLGGWDGRLVAPDNASVWGFSFPYPQTLALVNGLDFAVAHRPVPFQAVNLLMTFIITPLDSEPAQFYIELNPQDYTATAPRYLDNNWDDPQNQTLVDMVPYPAGGAKATFTVNGVALAAESSTLDALKALYR